MQKKKSDLRVGLRLFLYFFKIGWFTFGGGFSIIAQMQKDFVIKRREYDEKRMLDITSIGRSLPGLMVANVCYLFGYDMGGFAAGLMSVVGIILPPIAMLAVITLFYAQFSENIYVARALIGIRAAVPMIILSAALNLRKGAFSGWWAYVVCAAGLALSLFTGVNIVFMILGGAIIGIIVAEVKKRGLPEIVMGVYKDRLHKLRRREHGAVDKRRNARK